MSDWLMRMELPEDRRVLAVSDIHGNSDLLRGLLEKAEFGGEDVLFVLGDMIGNGPDSLGALRMIMQLANTHPVYPLQGNWEFFQLALLEKNTPAGINVLFEHIRQARRNRPGNPFDEAFRELGIAVESPGALAAAWQPLQELLARELAFLRGLPTVIDTPYYTFVHGGLPPGGVGAVAANRLHSQCLKVDAFVHRGFSFEKWLVVGHWPATLYRDRSFCNNPYVAREQRIVSIDGGCSIKSDGQLNALVLPPVPDGAFPFLAWDGFPVVTAGSRQEEGPDDPVHVVYPDTAVTPLEESGEFTYVEHHSTGSRFWALTDSLWRQGEHAHCEYSGYRLPVEPGEKLSLVRRTSRGCWVKKEGICGRYDGPVLSE